MTTVDDALADCQSATSDTTTASQLSLMRWLNRGYASVLSQFGKHGIIKTMQTTTNVPSDPMQFSDRSYLTPPDYLFIKTVKVMIGSRYYDLIEEESDEMWDFRTQYVWGGIPSTYFVADNFGFVSSELQIDPICTTTTTTGSTYIPASGSSTNGTLSLTFASLPTGWIAGVAVTLGGIILSDGTTISGTYYIQSVTSDTVTFTITDTTANLTVTTLGTAATTTGVPMVIKYESMDINLDHIGVTPNPIYPAFQTATAANVTFSYANNVITSSQPIFSGWMSLGGSYITAGDDGDGNWYKINAVNSSTSATIQQYYQGTTITSSQNWSINQVMNLHPDMVDLPNYYALWKYYLYKKDAKWRDYYKGMYYTELKLAQGNWSTKSRSSIIRSKQGVSRWHTYPGWFPSGGVTG